MSSSLQPHGLQHTRLPCPSPTPRAFSISCPLSRWCHPIISSSVIPFFSRLQSFPAAGSFQMSQLFASGGQSTGVGCYCLLLDSILKSRDITLPTKVYLVKAIFFSSTHVWMWELDYKESWAPKNWCFWTVVLEKTLESALDCKEIQPVHPKGNQSWIFIGRTDAEAETPILWPPDVKSWVIGKVPDAGKVWRQEEKGMTEDEMVGWHHGLNGHEFE